MRPHKIWLTCFALFLATATLSQETEPEELGQNESAKTSDNSEIYAELDRFGAVLNQIQSDYVEEVDPKALINAAINGMLSSLDPHSSYLDPEAVEVMQEVTSGEFGGLGVDVTQEDGILTVISVLDLSPAAKAGLKTGDMITTIDGESIVGLSFEYAVSKLRGPIGSSVILGIIREGQTDTEELELTREAISSQSVAVYLEHDVAIIRLIRFDEQSLSGMLEGIKQVQEEAGSDVQIAGYVLDLRNNPGGLLKASVEITDAFLNAGEIVSTRGRHDNDTGRSMATEGDVLEGLPLVVLVDRGSASASEIVAGALQDHHRAVIVGTRTFGKGSVQTIIPLDPTHAIRLTTARYYTPSGRSIQGLGIEPDVYIEDRPPLPEEPEDGEKSSSTITLETDLEGSLENDSLSEEEIQILEAERLADEELTKIRGTDIQLSYGIDIIHSLKSTREE